MDVTDDPTMVAGVRRILAEEGRLDALVNNPGYGSYGSVEHVPLDEARRQFEDNVFGMARLIQLVTPHMRSRQAGRIVNISSIGGKIYEPLGAWYHATEFAVEGLSDSLRIELRPFGIDVVIIEPGPILSEWNTIARESLVERSRGTVYERRAKAMARQFERTDSPRLSSGPEAVAEKVMRAVTTVNPAARYPAGRGARAVTMTRRLLPDRAMDVVIRSIYREGRRT
jgi:NAD(P)-dependent dehydrogenase (short-subunit alcohol dehydrogenase family)